MSEKYRLFIDEVGNSDLKASSNPNQRYLSLTGIIFKLNYAVHQVEPDIEKLKREFFNASASNPVILHRRELVRALAPFENLKNQEVKAEFDAQLLHLFSVWDYQVITVVIDKLEHVRKYSVWHSDPYHYCLKVMLERYVKYLQRCDAVGDVLAEARGKKEDKRLKSSFQGVYAQGTGYLGSQDFANHITSRELKLKTKKDDLACLQIADLIAHPSYRSMKMVKEGITIPGDFGKDIVSILERDKYYRHRTGTIEGYGRKWLP
jgi:hypothetical protein